MTLDAGVVGADIIHARRIENIIADWFLHVRSPGPWHFSQPTFHSVTGLGVDIVIHRVATVAERSGGPLEIVRRIQGRPPIGALGTK